MDVLKKVAGEAISIRRELYIFNHKKNREHKENVYEMFLSSFPAQITIMPSDFICDSTCWHSAESAQIAMKYKEKLYEEELGKFEENHNSFTYLGLRLEIIEEKRTELNNIKFFNKYMEMYLDEYIKITNMINSFKESEKYNFFQTYASINVQNYLVDFEVAYHNAYHTSCGAYSISKEDINYLRRRVLFGIRQDLEVT